MKGYILVTMLGALVATGCGGGSSDSGPNTGPQSNNTPSSSTNDQSNNNQGDDDNEVVDSVNGDQSVPCEARVVTVQADSDDTIFVDSEARSFNPSANEDDTVLCRGFLNGTEIFSSTENITHDLAVCGGARGTGGITPQDGDTFKVTFTYMGKACSDSKKLVGGAPASLSCGGSPSPGTSVAVNQQTVATVSLKGGSTNTADYTLSCNGIDTGSGSVALDNNGEGSFNLIPANECGFVPNGDAKSVALEWKALNLFTSCSWPIQ